MFASLQLDAEVVVNVLELEDVDVHWTIECDSIPTPVVFPSVWVDIKSVIIVEEPEVTDTHLMSCSTVHPSNGVLQLLVCMYMF